MKEMSRDTSTLILQEKRGMVAEFVVSITNLEDCALMFEGISFCKCEGKNGKMCTGFPFGSIVLPTHFSYFL